MDPIILQVHEFGIHNKPQLNNQSLLSKMQWKITQGHIIQAVYMLPAFYEIISSPNRQCLLPVKSAVNNVPTVYMYGILLFQSGQFDLATTCRKPFSLNTPLTRCTHNYDYYITYIYDYLRKWYKISITQTNNNSYLN